MTSGELRQKYLEFFESKGHKIIPSAPLVPENDQTTLFTGSGMQSMIPYLLGKTHPEGKKITDSQTCFRSQDIEEVGDNRHTTFFEMLGNWSLGDYFKEEQLPWIFEFLTEIVGLNPEKIYVSVFAGDEKYNLPKDNESADIWKKLFADKGIQAKDVELGTEEKAGELGMQDGRIFYYGVKKNLWSRFNVFKEIAENEPFGPDSEMFYEFTEIEHNPKYGKYCHPNCDCGRFLEIGNSVFMEYKKLADNKFEPLPNKNVDFGGGLERILAVSQNEPDVFKTDLFWSVIQKLEAISNKKYTDYSEEFRIITDHLKASTFLILDEVIPSNKLQGYVLRRILRSSMVKMHQLSGKVWNAESVVEIIETIFDIYKGLYNTTEVNQQKVFNIVTDELNRFAKTLSQGLKEIEKIEKIDGKLAFDLYQTFGFPLEISEELFNLKGQIIDHCEFEKEFTAHKELSRTASAGMFKGGLREQSEITIKYHTATHLLHSALRKILGEDVAQKGSNITSERLRFDFSYPEKISEEDLQKIENLINQKIKESLPVTSETMKKEDALNSGALGFFMEKYGDQVTVYTIGDFSKEICGGPHVENTNQLGKFKIQKEESVSSGIRRIYAVLYPK